MPTARWVGRHVLQAFPGLAELRGYDRRRLRPDLLAGVSVAAVAVPASLGMGELVGVSPVAGLYATLFPLAAYALFGSSRQLVVGPEGTLSALAGTIVAAAVTLGGADGARTAAYAAGLALVVGAVQIVAGVCRLGFMADFLSKPVLLGYINGVAVIIITGQLGKLLGVTVSAHDFVGQLRQLLGRLGHVQPATVAVSVGLFAAYGLLRRFLAWLPASLAVVVLAGAASVTLNLGDHGVTLVGTVPRGLPTPALPDLTISGWTSLLLPGVGLGLVGFADAVATVRTMAAKHGYPVSPDRELIGLGAANAVAGLTRAIPVGSSGSRTALADRSGSTSKVTLLVAAALATVAAAFATPLIEPLPTASLGVVIVGAAMGLFNLRGVWRLRRVHATEVALAAGTFVAVLLLGVLQGLLVAIVLSVGVYVYHTVRPHDAVLGAVADIDGYRDVEEWPAAVTEPGLIVYRFDAPLYFPNAPYLKRRVTELLDNTDGPVRWLLLDVEAVTYIDATAITALRELHAELAARGVVLAIARAKAPLRRVFATSGLADTIGADRLYHSVRAGVAAYQRRTPDRAERSASREASG
jgi:sulfate permease, SulP family